MLIPGLREVLKWFGPMSTSILAFRLLLKKQLNIWFRSGSKTPVTFRYRPERLFPIENESLIMLLVEFCSIRRPYKPLPLKYTSLKLLKLEFNRKTPDRLLYSVVTLVKLLYPDSWINNPPWLFQLRLILWKVFSELDSR